MTYVTPSSVKKHHESNVPESRQIAKMFFFLLLLLLLLFLSSSSSDELVQNCVTLS